MKYYESLVFNTFGEVPIAQGISKEGYFHGYWGIQYNHSGSLFFSRNGETDQLFEGAHAFLTYPDTLFRYGAPPMKHRHHCFVCFSGSLIRRFISGGLLPVDLRNPVIPIIHSEKFYSVFRQLVQLIRQPGGSLNPRAAWMLEDLLLQLQEQPDIRIKINAFCESELQDLRSRICQYPLQNWDFEAEAKRLSVSYSHFRRLFHEIAGCAPKQYLIEARLKYAEKMLVSGVLPIAEIAHRCGFPDEYYFSRLFKKHRLISPSALRNSVH